MKKLLTIILGTLALFAAGVGYATEIAVAAAADLKFALDELIYVLQGRGVTTVWTDDGAPKKTFEWQDRSLCDIGSNCYQQLSNMRGDQPARVLRYSYLPLAMSLVTDPRFYFNNPFQKAIIAKQEGDTYSEA
jgi:hypothetical protein